VLGADDRMLSKTRKDDLVPSHEIPRSVFRLERVTVQSYSASGRRDGDAQGLAGSWPRFQSAIKVLFASSGHPVRTMPRCP